MVSSGSRIASDIGDVAEETARRLPMPLAQLFRRSANCKTVIDAHLTAFSLAEASIKLLSASAIVHFAEQPTHDPALVECLRKLARPSLGHWWEFARRLIPSLAERHAAFAHVRSMLLERAHNDCPRAAGLDAAILTALGRKPSGGLTIRFRDVFDHIIEYRNKVLYHAAPAALSSDLHEQMAGAFQRGMGEILAKVDVLAGSQLIYVSEVRQSHGQWLVSRFDLTGENSRKQPPLELPRSATATLPDGEQLYLQDSNGHLRSLHPFVVYDSEQEEVLLLNSRRGSAKSEYLCYTSGRTEERPDMGEEQRRLFADVLGMNVTTEEVDAWAQATRIEEGTTPDEDESLPQRMLGEFELISELGRGGMGIVYRALQPSLGREVALKKLVRTSGGSEQRFLREIRALGRVEHQHLVKILTSGSVGEDWYYAMELVDGVPLSSVCSKLQHGGSAIADLDLSTWQAALSTACSDFRHQEKLLSNHVLPAAGAHVRHAETVEGGDLPTRVKAGRDYIERIVTLMRQVAGALESLHDANIIHRDVKPGNIMVSADGQRAMLMDLGLAQLADEEEGRLTRTRQFVGTLRYASPEQILAAERLSRRSDVYSLGATLWELLTLRPLFDAEDGVNEAEVMRRIQLDEPDNVRKHNPRVDRDLDAIVMKCLEKKPDRRYATARELAEDLRRWYRGEPVLARRVTKLERSARWFLRRPALLSACAFGILAVVLGTGGGLAAWGYVLSQRDVKKATDAENDAKRARDALSVSNDQLVAQTEQLTAARDELTANNLQLTDATKKATEAAAQAVAAERVASQAANALDRVVYANKILLARTYWEMGNAIRAREEMQRCKPQYRGWEWRKLLMEVNAPLLGTAESDLGENLIVASDERGSRAAVVDENGKIHLLACETPAMEIDEQHPAIREVAVLEGSEHLVRALALSGDGRRLGAIFPRSLRVWDAENGRLLGDGPLPGEVVAKLTFSDAGNLLAVEQGDHALQVWQIPSSGAPVRLATCTGHGDVVNALQFTPDERGLISAGNDAQLFLWDARTGRKVLKFGTGAPDDTRKAGEAVLSGISQMTVSFDGAWVATCEYAGDVTIWNAKDGRRCARLIHKLSAEQSEASHLPIAALVFSPDATQLAAVEGAVVTVWDLPPALATANPSQAPPEFTPSSIVGEGSETLFAARFCPDGQVLVTTGVDESVDLWKVASGEKIQSLSGHRAAGRHIAIRPDGAEVVSVDLNGAVFRWDLATGATVKKDMVLLKGHFDKIHQLEYSRDSQHLVTASSDGTARIWDAESGEQQHSFSVPDDDEANPSFAPIERVALNADFTQLALGTNDGRVQLWDPLNGALVQELQGVQAKSGDFGRLGLAQTIDFSPEAMRLAIASLDGSIQLWSMQAGSAPIVVHEHAGEINCLRFSRDGQLLISGGADGKVCAWDATQGAMVKLLNDGGPHAVHSVAFSPDGTLAAFGLSDRTVHLCDLRSGENLTLPDRFGVTQSNDDLGVLTLTFSQRGNLLAAAGDDNTVVIWDVPSGEFVTQLAGHTGQVRQIVFSPNDSKVATASADNTGRIWDLRTTAEPGRSSGRRTIVLRDTKNPPQFGHTGRINMVAFSADGKWLATCSDDRTTQAWNAESGSHLRTFSDHTDSIRAIAISPDGNRLVSACDDGRVRIWDTSRVMEEVAPAAPDEPVQSIGGSITNTAWTSLNGPFATYQGHSGGVGFVRFTRDGGQVLSAVTGNAPVAQLWNTSDFAKHGEFRGQVIEGSNSARCLKLSRHGDWLAANGPVATSIGVWSVHDRQQKWMLHTHPRAVTTFEFSPDGAFLASGCLDGVLRIWSMQTGGLETELAGHASQAAQSKVDGGIRHLAFSQDGQTIATAGGDGAVRLWNVPTRKELRTLIGHTDAVLHVEFNPQNENMLASSSRDETAILWDLTQGKAERVIDGHEGGVVGSTFDPVTGSRLVTASEDGTMLVSDAENAQTLSKFTQLKRDDRIAPLIAFRPDGKQLAVTTDEYVVQLLQTEETPAQHAERVNQWRMTSVDAAQTAKNWQGMLFHLGYLLPAVDDVALLHYQHGIALAELERWQESRRAFERTLELVSGFPDSQCTVYMRLGLVQLKCNDEPAFKNTLRALVETAEQQRVNGNTNFSNDINAGWLAALRSGAAVNFDKLISRVQEAVASDENSVYWRETLGLLLYRARQYDRAVVELERAVEQSNGTDLEAQFILSLALHRLGRGKEGLARYTDALRKMGAWQDDVPPDARQPDVVPTSWEYREQRLWFQAEAETVFREEIAPDVPQS